MHEKLYINPKHFDKHEYILQTWNFKKYSEFFKKRSIMRVQGGALQIVISGLWPDFESTMKSKKNWRSFQAKIP